MGLKEVKIKLKTLKKDELIMLISDLYKKNKPVKEYLEYWLEPDEEKLWKIYVKKVVEAFYPKQGYKVRLINGKKAISDFKKFKPNPILIADLMIIYIEVGTDYSVEIGDYDSKILTSIHSMLYDCLSYLHQNSLVEVFRKRFEDFVNLSEKVGDFFHEITMQMLFDFIPDFLFEEEKITNKAIVFELPKK